MALTKVQSQMLSSGSQVAFSAYLSSPQSVTSGVATKVAFNAEDFDTNNNFASGTFTPTVAGYYQINACVAMGGTANTQGVVAVYIYKNGASYKTGTLYANYGTAGSQFGCMVSAVVYCNGSTDYIDIYGFNQQTGSRFDQTATWVNGALVAAA